MPKPSNPVTAALLVVLAGSAGAGAWPPLSQTWLAWVCVAPLLVAVRGRNFPAAALLGWLWGFAYEGGVAWWVQATLAEHTGLGTPAILAVHVGMAAILGSATALVAVVVAAGTRRGRGTWWLAPAAWVAVDWLRGQTAFWFPWTHLGYTQAAHLPLVQIAALTGVYGVTALVVFANAVMAEAATCGDRRMAVRWVAVGVVVVLVAGAFGALRLRFTTPAPRKLRVALVDGGIGERDKWQPDYADVTLRRYLRLTTAAAAERPELVVWPETALPFFFEDPGPRRERVLAVARRLGIPLVVGAPAADVGPGPGLRQRNRVHLLGSDGAALAYYDKRVLVPFGEYVPTRWLAARVPPVAPAAAPIEPGAGSATLSLPALRVGVLVCYENVFPWLARRAVADGAAVLVNPSNDAWYARVAAPAQQLAHTVLRAVESGVPVVRVANRGILAVADGRGRLLLAERPGMPTWRVVEVPLNVSRSPYARWGDVFAWACAVVALLSVALRATGPAVDDGVGRVVRRRPDP